MKVLGSEMWSAGSLRGRASRVERKDLAKESSVIFAVFGGVLRAEVGWSGGFWGYQGL